MKYSASNKPLVCMQNQSTCYKSTSTMTVKGVLWHSTGANNPNLKRYVQPSDNAEDREKMLELLGVNYAKNDWNHISHQAGLNCWIGKLADGTVTTVQTMPWNYRPWGCGSGSRGSCNNGWIQFEICEASLTDKTYFNAAYKEACEITAYLCDMYNIDPHGTVNVNGVQVPTILCHADSYKLGLGSNHGDVNHWFPKHGKSMETVRDDVAELMGVTSAVTPSVPVQPEEDNVSSSELKIGDEVRLLSGAKYTSGKSIPNWLFDRVLYVRDVNTNGGIIISILKTGAITGVVDEKYLVKQKPTVSGGSASKSKFSIGDEVRLISGAKYTSGKSVASFVFNRKLYVRAVNGDNITISTLKTGAITGIVDAKYLVEYNAKDASASTEKFSPYLVKVNTSSLNIRKGAGTNYSIAGSIKNGGVYTIVEEADGQGATKWGLLKAYKDKRNGWISLDHVKRT